MSDESSADRLFRELFDRPTEFDDAGKAYTLLQEFFAGLPLDRLRPLLRSEDVFVQRAGAFVASELGIQAQDVVDDVIPLVDSSDRHVAYYAMEVLAVCCEGAEAPKFVRVLKMLESDDQALRLLAMRLASRADRSQLEAAARTGEAPEYQMHARGARLLLAHYPSPDEAIVRMISDEDPLTRKYGAIGAKRMRREYPQLMNEVASSRDADLMRFAETN